MRAVLGIDAAWTLTQPSGVALAAEEADGWHLVVAESSYQRFLARVDSGLAAEERPSGAAADVPGLLSAAMALSGGSVDVVAVDMPLTLSPIVGRRASDNAVSKAYGGRKCGTHSPSAQRPGYISDQLRELFYRAGYPLRTTSMATPGLIGSIRTLLWWSWQAPRSASPTRPPRSASTGPSTVRPSAGRASCVSGKRLSVCSRLRSPA